MNFIMLDLEFNKPTKNAKYTKIASEILQIGCVVLDEQKNFIKTFNEYIRPKFHKIVNPYILDLMCVNENIIFDKGIFFLNAMNKLRDFIGKEDFIFVTWGGQDIQLLKENCDVWNIITKWFDNKRVIDFQDYYMNKNELDFGKQIGLVKALENEELPFQSENTHGASYDCMCLSYLFQKYNTEDILNFNPTLTKSKRIINKYEKYIEMFDNINYSIQAEYYSNSICNHCSNKLENSIEIKPYYYDRNTICAIKIVVCHSCKKVIKKIYEYNIYEDNLNCKEDYPMYNGYIKDIRIPKKYQSAYNRSFQKNIIDSYNNAIKDVLK